MWNNLFFSFFFKGYSLSEHLGPLTMPCGLYRKWNICFNSHSLLIWNLKVVCRFSCHKIILLFNYLCVKCQEKKMGKDFYSIEPRLSVWLCGRQVVCMVCWLVKLRNKFLSINDSLRLVSGTKLQERNTGCNIIYTDMSWKKSVQYFVKDFQTFTETWLNKTSQWAGLQAAIGFVVGEHW